MTVDRDVFQFIREHVRSVWALELLLRLKHDPGRCWSVGELVGDLRASHSLVTDNLTAFVDAGLVVADERGCFRYQPAAAVLAKVCDDLERSLPHQARHGDTLDLGPHRTPPVPGRRLQVQG